MAYKIKGSFNRPLKGSVLDTITVNDNSFQNWIRSNVLPKGIAKTLVWNWYGIDPTKTLEGVFPTGKKIADLSPSEIKMYQDLARKPRQGFGVG